MCKQVWTQQATLVSWGTVKTLWKSKTPDASQRPAWLAAFSKVAALGPGQEPSSCSHHGSKTTAGFSLCFMAGQAHVPGGVRGHRNTGPIAGQHCRLGPPRTRFSQSGTLSMSLFHVVVNGHTFLFYASTVILFSTRARWQVPLGRSLTLHLAAGLASASEHDQPPSAVNSLRGIDRP